MAESRYKPNFKNLGLEIMLPLESQIDEGGVPVFIKEGTKENMLTEALLDGANFPEIRLEGNGVVGSLDAASLPVSIQMLGRTIEQTFPASISITEDSVLVQGEYQLTHADLGLEPFSLLGGAMAVGAEIDFTYRLRANVVAQ
ncbi:MAG: hypothetical protein O3C37_10075 [Proteobacteria bacterium]|nr:hypothetical protein [Pseudomonadota bacterium]